mmetsp:Transcript_15338/g.23615  ORF Transcript_15338/g.23615 Transcript_15338/m.23615 type:complete len:152 (+) Transcript_15338:281-736(+)
MAAPSNGTKAQEAKMAVPANSSKQQEAAAPSNATKVEDTKKEAANASKQAPPKKLSPLEKRKMERIADKLRQKNKDKARKIPVVTDNYNPDLEKVINRDSNTTLVNFTNAWSQLNEREKNYAYYITKASWAGAKMVFHQMSYESPPLFLIF